MIWWPFNMQDQSDKELLDRRNSPMIWWPFNLYSYLLSLMGQSRNSPMIWWPFNLYVLLIIIIHCRNSPMIWWPFNNRLSCMFYALFVVTHQWSGDLSIDKTSLLSCLSRVVTHQWSGDLSMLGIAGFCASASRNSPMIWWPFNWEKIRLSMQKSVVTHQWSGDLSIR